MTETTPDPLSLPLALTEVFSIGFSFEWDDETETARGCGFEPYETFEAPARTAEWYLLWTGNPQADWSEFRFFGSTGAGDYAGFFRWVTLSDRGRAGRGSGTRRTDCGDSYD